MVCQDRFEQIYKRSSEGLSFCPYRICPIGAHCDHNLGKITGFAINKGIHLAYRPKQNGVIELTSIQFPKRAQWHISNVEKKTGDWADYLRGATWALTKNHPLHTGICGVIEGSLPIGGLSSSSAVIIAFLTALCNVNGIRLSSQQMIQIAYEAESQYVGVNIGKLDQYCEVLCKKDQMLYLDCKDGDYSLIPASKKMKPFQIALLFSGLEHSLIQSKYNMRVDELRAGVYALQAFSGGQYGRFNETNARDVSWSVYQAYKDLLPSAWAKRCEHWYTEYQRVENGVQAWLNGDIEKFGRLCFESGWSSIHNWESGAPEQIKLYELMRETPGIYGGRFSGAGFKGFCIALIDPQKTESIQEFIESKYLDAYPGMKGKYSFHVCESADGAGA